RPSIYSPGPYLITRHLIEEGRRHLLLGGMIETGCPVRILQGVADPDVPWQHAVALTSRFARDDVVLTLIKDGHHRLSRPADVARSYKCRTCCAAVGGISGRAVCRSASRSASWRRRRSRTSRASHSEYRHGGGVLFLP